MGTKNNFTLLEAIANCDEKLAKELIKHSEELESRTVGGYTPLHLCASLINRSDDYIQLASLLIGAGADINSKLYEEGASVIFTAASNGSLELVKLLIDNGANPLEVCDESSILIEAVISGDLDLVRYLVKLSLDPMEKVSGRSAYDVACEYEWDQIASYFNSIRNLSN